ncbi:glutathione S-transferase N-terminal domain-containing protein, partial [Candidatus Aquicultor sp.]
MVTLHHHPLCPQSRFVRLFLGEYGIDPQLIEEKPFERRQDYLLLDPAGETPLLIEDNGMVVPGAAVIA